MGEARVLCPNITETLKSVIISLCQSNIQFSSQLSVLGSIHVLADGEQVVSCLLKETQEKTHDRGSHNSHRRERNTEETEKDQLSNAHLPSPSPRSNHSQNTVFFEPMESTFDPLLEIKTEAADVNDHGLATASNEVAQDGQIMPKNRKRSSHPALEFATPVAQSEGQRHSSDEMVFNSSETESSGSQETLVRSINSANSPKSKSTMSKAHDSPANLSYEFCGSTNHNSHRLEPNIELMESDNTVFAEPVECTFDPLLKIKTEAVDLNDHGFVTDSRRAAHEGEILPKKRKRLIHPAPEFITPFVQTDRQNPYTDGNGPAQSSVSQETLVIHIKPAKLQKSTSGLSRTCDSSASLSPEFRCTKCQDALGSKSDLQAHLQDCHPQNNRKQTTTTMRRTTTAAAAENNLTCRVCKVTFPSIASLREHSKLCILKCHMCQQTFGLNSDYVRHFKNVHNKNLYSCPTCNRTFKSGDGLKCHMNTAHDRNKVYPCGLCSARFLSRQSAYFHRKTLHPAF